MYDKEKTAKEKNTSEVEKQMILFVSEDLLERGLISDAEMQKVRRILYR